MWKTIAITVLILFASGCATVAATPRPSEILSCKEPKAEKRYVCFSDEECLEYVRGYSAVFTMKTAPLGGFYGLGEGNMHPVIHVHLHYAHDNMTMVGRIEGELREHPEDGKQWYQKMWIIICGTEEEGILHEAYYEGFRTKSKNHDYDIDPE